MDAKDYLACKEAGTISVARADVRNEDGEVIGKHPDAVYISAKRFDPNTGKVAAPLVTELSIAEVRAKRDAIQSQADDLDAMLADMEAT